MLGLQGNVWWRNQNYGSLVILVDVGVILENIFQWNIFKLIFPEEVSEMTRSERIVLAETGWGLSIQKRTLTGAGSEPGQVQRTVFSLLSKQSYNDLNRHNND